MCQPMRGNDNEDRELTTTYRNQAGFHRPNDTLEEAAKVVRQVLYRHYFLN